ncbi:MAG: hypothetical protein HY719_13340, partial [Planctomycetes bacterium]|nr:hypothetical protein [Planctomycetota bacterium]
GGGAAPPVTPTVSEEEVAKIVFRPVYNDNPPPIPPEHFAFMRANREQVIPLLKKWAAPGEEHPRGNSEDYPTGNSVWTGFWFGEIGGPSEVPFLVQRMRSLCTSNRKNQYEAEQFAKALAKIDTAEGVAAICTEIEKAKDNRRFRYGLVSALRHSGQPQAIDVQRQLAWTGLNRSEQRAGFEGAVKSMTKAGRTAERDEFIVAALDDPKRPFFDTALGTAIHFAVIAGHPKIKEHVANPEKIEKSDRYTLALADSILTALQSKDPNTALLEIIRKDPYEPTVTGALGHLKPEEGLADRVLSLARETRPEMLEKIGCPENANMWMMRAVKKFGGTVPEEDEHWPRVKDPKTGQWVFPKPPDKADGK